MIRHALSLQVGLVMEKMSGCAGANFPFENGRCHFKDSYKFSDLLLRVFLIKRKKIAAKNRTRIESLSVTSTPPHLLSSKVHHILTKFSSSDSENLASLAAIFDWIIISSLLLLFQTSFRH